MGRLIRLPLSTAVLILAQHVHAATAEENRVYWLDDGEDKIGFIQESDRGTIFGVHVDGPHSFVMVGHGTGTFAGDYRVRTDDGRFYILYRSDFSERLTSKLWEIQGGAQQRIYTLPPDERTKEKIAAAVSDRNAELAAAQAKRSAEIEAARQAYLAKKIVTLGMTMDEVRGSRWGEPKHESQSITAAGTEAVWTYSLGNMVFFNNDKVVRIETSH